MEAYQIIAGFSDIKVAFRKKVNSRKRLQELQLWFTFDGNTLYVHDQADHKSKMELATFDIKCGSWHICLESGSLGERLVDVFVTTIANDKLVDILNDSYKSHGFL